MGPGRGLLLVRLMVERGGSALTIWLSTGKDDNHLS